MPQAPLRFRYTSSGYAHTVFDLYMPWTYEILSHSTGKTTETILRVFACLLLLLVVAGCSGNLRTTEPATPAQKSVADVAFLDRLVTPENIFPDPAQRKLFRTLPPSGTSDERSYTFQFIPVDGMNESRHFLLLTITWSKTTGAQTAEPQLTSTGGPGGGFVDAVVQTDDHLWSIRVSLGSLMPADVDTPDIAPAQIASELRRIYRSSMSQQ